MTIHDKLAELIQQARAEGRTVEQYRANGESYTFITRTDGWIQIVNVTDPCSYRPEIEARDRAHAVSYCELLEPLRVPVAELVPSGEEGPTWRS